MRAASQMSCTGRTSAVGEVICETTIARVRIPIFAISSSGSTCTTLARMKPSVRRIAPYSCFVVRISSSGRIRSERMTALSADVAFGENTRSSVRAPTKAASAARALVQRRLESPCEELRRLALELVLEPLVLVEDLDRARAVAAVIEVRDLRVEEKARTHAWLVSHGARTRQHVLPASASFRVDAPGGRARQRVRQRDGDPVHVHLPAQRARDRASVVSGLIVAAHALVSIVAGPIFGSQIDRFGGKRMLALSLAILTVGYAGYALVQEPWQGFLVAVVSGIGIGGFWPAQSTLITALTPRDQRPSAFAMQRVVMNLGIGLGALTGGLIATTDSPETFTVLFLLDAVTFLVYAFVMYALVPEPDLRGRRSTRAAPGRIARCSATARSSPSSR